MSSSSLRARFSARGAYLKQSVGSALVLVAFGHLIIEFSNNYLPILYPRLMPIMGLSYAQIGLIALVSSTVYSLAQPLFGYIGDRWDPIWVVSASIIWIGLTMGLVGLAPSYVPLLFIVALGGLGSAAFHPPATVVAVANSGKRRGSGLSVFSVGGNIGTALSPLWMGVALGALGLPGTLTIMPIAVTFGILFFVLMRRNSVARGVNKQRGTEATGNVFVLGIVLLIAAMGFRSWYQVAFMTYLPAWVEGGGGTPSEGSRMLALLLFSISVGSVVGGISGDRWGHLQVLLVSLLVLPLTHWAFLNSGGAAQFAALALSGIAVGTTFPNSIVLVLAAWPKRAGMAAGLLMGLGWWPGGLGASLTGLIADNYSLTTGLAVLAFVPFAGAAVLAVYGFTARAAGRSEVRRMSPD